MPVKNLPLQRSLSILCRLQRSPLARPDLVTHVQVELGLDVYPDQEKASQRVFEEDIQRLRDLGVILTYNRKEKVYQLVSYDEFNPVGLTETALNTLAFLSESFGPDAPNGDKVQQLVRLVADWLPDNQGDSIASRRQQFRLDLRHKDDGALDRRIDQAVERALQQGRLLRFGYRSPSQADGIPRVHLVQPWQTVFDTIRGHYYLDAYWLHSTGPYGKQKQEKWQKFRLDCMVADEIEVLPDKRPPSPPPRPRLRLEYLLSPMIARTGHVTRHFDNMQVHETDDAGWVRVTATTDDLFRAVRLLLYYGANCKVIGGPEARREIQALVKGLAALYDEST